MNALTTIHIDRAEPWPAHWLVPGPGTSQRVRRDVATRAEVYRSVAEQQALVHLLYEDALHADPLWHFLLEPRGVTLIRVSEAACLAEATALLRDWEVRYRTYPYPFPGDGLRDPDYYGEGPDTLIGQHNALFLPILHAHAVAALEFSDEEFCAYLERVVHCACVPKWAFQEVEDDVLAELAERRRTWGQD